MRVAPAAAMASAAARCSCPTRPGAGRLVATRGRACAARGRALAPELSEAKRTSPSPCSARSRRGGDPLLPARATAAVHAGRADAGSAAPVRASRQRGLRPLARVDACSRPPHPASWPICPGPANPATPTCCRRRRVVCADSRSSSSASASCATHRLQHVPSLTLQRFTRLTRRSTPRASSPTSRRSTTTPGACTPRCRPSTATTSRRPRRPQQAPGPCGRTPTWPECATAHRRLQRALQRECSDLNATMHARCCRCAGVRPLAARRLAARYRRETALAATSPTRAARARPRPHPGEPGRVPPADLGTPLLASWTGDAGAPRPRRSDVKRRQLPAGADSAPPFLKASGSRSSSAVREARANCEQVTLKCRKATSCGSAVRRGRDRLQARTGPSSPRKTRPGSRRRTSASRQGGIYATFAARPARHRMRVRRPLVRLASR